MPSAPEIETQSKYDALCARVTELESERATLLARIASLEAKVKVASDLLEEGHKGFGRVLIATGDDKAVYDWRKRCGAALAKLREPT